MRPAKQQLHNTSLSSRRGLRRTFGGMAAFLSVAQLALGTYLIHDQFADPVGSHPAGLLFAAVLVASALVLLSYMVHPGARRRSRHTAAEWSETAGPVIEVQPKETREPGELATELPVHVRYVDHARILL